MKVRAKDIILALIMIFMLWVAGDGSFRDLIKVYTILNDKGTVTVKHSYVTFETGEGRSARPGRYKLSFYFKIDTITYHITNRRFEDASYYYYPNFWNDRVAFSRKEKFEVSYYKQNPYLCIPSKCIDRTIKDNAWAALSVVGIAGACLYSIIKRFLKYKKEKQQHEEYRDHNDTGS